MAPAAVTVCVGTHVLAAIQVPWAGVAFIPAALVAYVVWRVVADRLRNREDDHYDQIDK